MAWDIPSILGRVLITEVTKAGISAIKHQLYPGSIEKADAKQPEAEGQEGTEGDSNGVGCWE